MSEGTIDPRYDPRFQRGFSGSAAAAPAPAPASAPVRAPTAPPPAARTVVPAAGPAPSVPEPLPSSAGASGITVEVLGGEPPSAPGERRFNPFILLLWLAAPALIAAGSWVGYFAMQAQYSGMVGMQEAALYQFLVWTVAPPAVTAGLLTIVGLLFWHAASFRRART